MEERVGGIAEVVALVAAGNSCGAARCCVGDGVEVTNVGIKIEGIYQRLDVV